GQEINYTIVVKNSGNVSLTDIDLSSQGDLTFSGSPVINLAPGKSAELSALYTVTVADLDAGNIVKSVNVTGKDPDKQPVGTSSNAITVIGLQDPELSTIASALETNFSMVGEVIHYNILVKNSGNVSIISTAVTDPNAVIITARPNTILLPDESFMVSATHTITQADIDANMVVSEAKAVGFDLHGNTIEKLGNKVTVFGSANDVPVRLATVNFNLSNFPNPFSYETTIVFDLPENGKVILKVYDMTGREVGQIDQQEFNQGRNYVHWKTFNTQKGLYILKMYYNGNQAMKMISIIN
ncbi:MAG: T9SS type A sorting domain-containing protein, partial [Bacteroidota bacterium]